MSIRRRLEDERMRKYVTFWSAALLFQNNKAFYISTTSLFGLWIFFLEIIHDTAWLGANTEDMNIAKAYEVKPPEFVNQEVTTAKMCRYANLR